MLRKLCLIGLPALLLTTGCTSTEPFEEQIRALRFQNDAMAEMAEQATIDKNLAEKEVELAHKEARVHKEKLALAYDALREARTRVDDGLRDRLGELANSGVQGGGERLSISQYGGVVLKSGVLFRAGSHELSKAGRSALQPLVATLTKQEYDGYDIELAGHTDSDPIKHSRQRNRDNWDLASNRANSVRRFLVENGIPAERIHLSSWGPIRPFAEGDKAKNRRVEVMLRKKTAALPASSKRE